MDKAEIRYPKVSVIIPERNSWPEIQNTLHSIYSQEYQGELQVIIGMGSDPEPGLKLLDWLNKNYPDTWTVPSITQTTSDGLNAAIAIADGEIIARVDAHSELKPGYLNYGVRLLQMTEAAVVGGLQIPEGRTRFQKAVGYAMTSWLGNGGSRHKTSLSSRPPDGPIDTVYLGIFNAKIFKQVGIFDPVYIRNQDYEFNWRVRQAGKTVWFDSMLQVGYQPRQNILALWKQYFSYGWWKSYMIWHSIESIRFRQLAAPILVMGLAHSALGAAMILTEHDWILPAKYTWILPAVYSSAVIIESIKTALKHKSLSALIRLPLIYPVMHISWGLGFILSQLKTSLKFRRN